MTACLFLQSKKLMEYVEANMDSTVYTEAMAGKMVEAMHINLSTATKLAAIGNSFKFQVQHYDELAEIKTGEQFQAFLKKFSIKTPEEIDAEKNQTELVSSVLQECMDKMGIQ